MIKIFICAVLVAFTSTAAYVKLPTGGGGTSLPSNYPTYQFLTNDVDITNTGSTTSIAELSPALAANKKYLITWAMAFKNTNDGTAYWRFFPSFPANMVAFIVEAPGLNPGATVNTLTPSSNSQIVQASHGIQAQNHDIIFMRAVIHTGDAGTLSFGIRYVVDGTGTIFGKYSFVKVELLN